MIYLQKNCQNVTHVTYGIVLISSLIAIYEYAGCLLGIENNEKVNTFSIIKWVFMTLKKI